MKIRLQPIERACANWASQLALPSLQLACTCMAAVTGPKDVKADDASLGTLLSSGIRADPATTPTPPRNVRRVKRAAAAPCADDLGDGIGHLQPRDCLARAANGNTE